MKSRHKLIIEHMRRTAPFARLDTRADLLRIAAALPEDGEEREEALLGVVVLAALIVDSDPFIAAADFVKKYKQTQRSFTAARRDEPPFVELRRSRGQHTGR